MRTKYDKLHLYIHDKSLPPVGCGYYYIVTNGAMSHTAFRTKKALINWLNNTGLKIGKRTNYRSVELVGSYSSVMEMTNNEEFISKHAGKKPYYALCNGDYSIGFIEQTPEGNILYYQNPNTDRFILDYKKVMKHLETGISMQYIY